MERLWLQSYPSGIPSDIDQGGYASLIELFETNVRRFSDRPCFTHLGHTLTFSELHQKAQAFCAFLKGELGLRKGDRFAMMMPNTLQYPIAMLGALMAGVVVVNVNPLYTAHELAQQLKDSGARTLMVLANFTSVAAQALESAPVEHVIVTAVPDMLPSVKRVLIHTLLRYVKDGGYAYTKIEGAYSFREALTLGCSRLSSHGPVSVVREDIAFLQYTGGTTGGAKGAILTHANMVSNVAQAKAWMNPFVECGEELIITALPLYHIFSLMANCLTFMELGAHNVLVTNPRDTTFLIKTMAAYPFTAFTGVNTLFAAMLRHPDFSNVSFEHSKIILAGGMSLQKSVAEQWHQRTGFPIIEAYGLTETSPAVTINPLNLKHYNGSIGLPLPSTEISIRNETGEELPLGEVGELCVRGPQVMRGYWQQEAETRKIFFDDGFLKTGDIATVDAKGFVRIVDRKKDMIIVSGFNVYPNEIESVLVSHPHVVEAAVIGVPDERTGETVKAFVVSDSESLSQDDLLEYCRSRLTNYKLPKIVEFCKELPKSTVGKVLRRALRESKTPVR